MRQEQLKRTAEDPELQAPQEITPLQAGWASVQTLALAAFMLWAAMRAEDFLAFQPVPEQAQAAKIAETVQAIFLSVLYLAAFMFCMNGLGLAALGIKVAISGDVDKPVKPKEADELSTSLPDLNWQSNVEDVKKAFDAAAKPVRKQIQKNDTAQ